jgi:tRNA-2-methylthio-N6-dimethylallyladenosine synthase
MPEYFIWTIGCQMNKAESERLGSYLEHLGYTEASGIEEADLIVLNSCVVRQSAENRVTGKIEVLRRLKVQRPEVVLAVTGCLVDSDIAKLRRRFPDVDHFFQAGTYPPWLETPEPAQTLPEKPAVSGYVSIIQGCNNFCTYCIVPFRRGRNRSRPMAEVVTEVATLAARGAREITLLGQNVDAYGQDLPEKPDLADLLGELNRVNELLRLRFLTNHPADMSPRLIEAVAFLDRVCEHINIPVQSGSDEVLMAMGRGYTAAQYRQLITDIRSKIPEVALSTDIIVGFPGETEAQYCQTLDLLGAIGFDSVHVAAYSPRTGTMAARRLKDDVPAEEKKRRLDGVERLQTDIATDINIRLLDKTVEILVEGRKKGKWYGRTRSDKLVFYSHPDDRRGQLVKVRIDKTSPWSLQGTVEV